jgi:hypothetical protein
MPRAQIAPLHQWLAACVTTRSGRKARFQVSPDFWKKHIGGMSLATNVRIAQTTRRILTAQCGPSVCTKHAILGKCFPGAAL